MKLAIRLYGTLAIFALALVGGAGPAWGQEQFVEKSEVKEIVKTPEAFIGQKVQVAGKVEDVVVNGQSFILEGDGWFSNEILVVSKGRIVNLKEMADDKKRVNIVGTVKQANFFELENDLDSSVNPELELDKEKAVTYILLDRFQSEARFSE